jgi:FixJ family two-component response regulator
VTVGDDAASVRRARTRLLRFAEHRVLTYASATEILDSGIASAPDGVILDIHLGGMSGVKLFSQLREAGHSLPVLIITAHDDAHAREAAAQAGCAADPRKLLDAKAYLAEVAAAPKAAASMNTVALRRAVVF